MTRLSHDLLTPLTRMALWLGLITLAVFLSWRWNLDSLDRHTLSLAAERGRYTYKIIQATRAWVAMHGVAYVKTDEDTPSNPYLDIPERDITTPSGTRLTAINPAYMTRQLAGILAETHDLQVHLTSLMPLNPGNQPDPWEARALEQFPTGVAETIERVSDAQGDRVRYMAPLFVKKPCMHCHAKQGYQVGDVRGGISVSFDYGAFLEATAAQRSSVHRVHFAAWLVLSLFSGLTQYLLRRHERAIIRARDEAEALVKQRTHTLQEEVLIRRSTEAKLQLLINATEEGIFGIDDQGRVSFMNAAALGTLGYESPNSVVGKSVDEVFRRTHADGSAILPDDCQITSAWRFGLSGHSEDERYLLPNGNALAVEYHVHPLRSHGRVVGAVVNFSEISVRKALQEQIWRQANYDNLTGIPNRALFEDRFGNALQQARRGGFKLALAYIDLNHFKPINDHYGHAAGDEVLRSIGRRLSDHVRGSDTVARLGGDEFVVLYNQVGDRGAVEALVAKLGLELQKPIDIGEQEVTLTCAVGIALFPDDADTPETLLAKADQAMCRDKEQGESPPATGPGVGTEPPA